MAAVQTPTTLVALTLEEKSSRNNGIFRVETLLVYLVFIL